MSPYLMIWVSIVLSAFAQVLLKRGTNQMASRRSGNAGVAELAFGVLREPSIWLWSGCFVISTVLWLLGVQHLDLSYAFPLLSFGYILVTILSILFFKERVDAMRWIAVGVICAGVILIARS